MQDPHRLEELSKAVLNNPIYQEMFEQLKQRYYDAWCITNSDEQAKREVIWTSMRVLMDIEHYLKAGMVAGKMADHQQILERANQIQNIV